MLSSRGGQPSRLTSPRSSAPLLFIIVLAIGSACGRHSRPIATPSTHLAVRLEAVPTLAAEFDQLFGAPALSRALWAVMIQSLDSGETLYRLNANKLVMPASNMKIVTLAVAAERLGWNYRFETKLLASGAVDAGVLGGDLIIEGNGDPSINARGGPATRVFDNWAQQLWDGGIRRIAGRIIGVDDAFDDEALGAGWSWDYLGYGYAAPVGALEFNENLVDLAFRAGAVIGAPVTVEVTPLGSGLTVVSHVATSDATTPLTLDLRRLPGSTTLEVTGTVPVGTPEFSRTASVENATEYFANALRTVLEGRGIAVGGSAVDADALAAPPDLASAHLLVSYQSPPLSEMAMVLMKSSQNLYAETLLKTLGRQGGDGTAEGGRRAVREVLESWGITPDSFVMYDGSGLSRYNYVTAEMLVAILKQMNADSRHAAAFAATLPIAGQDGTLAQRLKGTRAEGQARAKTGSIANVRSLSGYVRTIDGELLAFSIIANHFTVAQEAIDALTDRAVERLANFSRK